MNERSKWLKIDSTDNVLVAIEDIAPSEIINEGNKICIDQRIPQKHKFLTTDLEQGEKVIMYGVPVATANTYLKKGSLLTTDNISHYAEKAKVNPDSRVSSIQLDVSKFKNSTFDGYHRADGKVGTANYWLFVPLVFCENRNLKVIEEALTRGLGYHQSNKYENYVKNLISNESNQDATTLGKKVFHNVDGIKFLYHHGGCGGTRQDSETLLRLLAGYVNHPNVAGATILSLGCQHAQINWFKEIQENMYPKVSKPTIYLEQQQMDSEEHLITEAIDKTIEGLKEANKSNRKPASLDKLVLGLECGGSDGFSGISGNPAVGHASDLIMSLGGSAILSEFPELNGVEQNIVDRCIDARVAHKFIALQETYEAQAKAVGSGFDMNPSPGNIKDGLITDAIKSAGAAKKGGKSQITDVLDYTEPLVNRGLNLLCTPGNDVESTTGMAASGANIILFTTGLGTPTGNPIVPVIKISTNSDLYRRMNDIIDINSGSIIEGSSTIEEVGEVILEEIISVASGKQTKAMKLSQNDFIPWKRGVSL